MTFNVYTDASVLPDEGNEAGVGAVVYCTEYERIIHSAGAYINRVLNVTMAEVVAIIYGLNQVVSVINDGGYDIKLVRICSDCTSALDLVSGEGASDEYEVAELIEILDEAMADVSCDVEFQWVRGHSDHRMNDLADYLAYHHAKG